MTDQQRELIERSERRLRFMAISRAYWKKKAREIKGGVAPYLVEPLDYADQLRGLLNPK